MGLMVASSDVQLCVLMKRTLAASWTGTFHLRCFIAQVHFPKQRVRSRNQKRSESYENEQKRFQLLQSSRWLNSQFKFSLFVYSSFFWTSDHKQGLSGALAGF